MTDMSDETRLTQMLERAPEVAVPADFAVRVRAALPERRVVRRQARAGSVVAVAAAVVLVVALFLLAPHVQAGYGSVSFYVELVMLGELFGIAYWLSARRGMRG